ncbi:MAG TPA: SRPBCC domain-containing protein [Symbiobacteriaceae bacterium]|nr:SRPBCC domain-containing protein [Symbiobacteriaceae bacterium]
MTAEFVLTREFNAPRELVFKAYTEADHLKQWFGPKGFPVAECKLDLRPGGVFHYALRSAGGQEMWGKWVFLEIASPERLTIISSFSDAEGDLTRHPMSPNWPAQTWSTMTLTEQDGRTTLTLVARPYEATEVENQTFAEGLEGMKAGFKGTYDQLETYLESLR